MAKPKKYFIRTADGHKGPYSFVQMKASIQARTLSSSAEYRTSEEEEWRPVKRLADKIAKDDATRRASRIEVAAAEESTHPRPQRPEARPVPRLAVIALLVTSAMGYFGFSRMARKEALGKSCHVPADCPSSMSCLLSVDDERNIGAEGYCTFACTDSSDCHSSMSCGEAIQADPQGVRWDGMIRKSTRMCLKR